MASRPLAVSRPVGDRVQGLVRAAYPKGCRYRESPQQGLGVTLADARQLGDYIRQLRAGRHQQPPPNRAWALGAALGVLSEKRWINSVTVLFACGHYGYVASLFLRAVCRFDSRSEFRELARTLRTVLQDNPLLGYSRIRDHLAIREAGTGICLSGRASALTGASGASMARPSPPSLRHGASYPHAVRLTTMKLAEPPSPPAS